MIGAAAFGFATVFALILAIGAQNAFMLRQGLIRQHVFWLALMFGTSDAFLIVVGVLGFGAIVRAVPALPLVMAIGGAIFLICYGAARFLAAWRGDYDMQLAGQSSALWPTLVMGAMMTWLNPHVYLDTIALVGAVSTQYETWPQRYAYAVGGFTASYVFFFTLGYGARLLAPAMKSAKAWQRLDVVIGVVMWALALKLLVDLSH